MAYSIHNQIFPSATLPYRKIKGSVTARNRLVKQYNKKFYHELNILCLDNLCNISDCQKALNKTLYPDKIAYSVSTKQDNSNYLGSIKNDISLETNRNVITIKHMGYRFNYIPSNTQGQIDKYTVFHETSHFFDHIINPKYNIYRFESQINNPENEKIYNQIRFRYLLNLNNPVKMKHLKKETFKLLNKQDNNAAIDTLQTLRQKLATEIKAYNNERKALLKSFKLESAFKAIQLTIFLVRNAKFKSKLKFINKLLNQRLTNARKELQVKIS